MPRNKVLGAPPPPPPLPPPALGGEVGVVTVSVAAVLVKLPIECEIWTVYVPPLTDCTFDKL